MPYLDWSSEALEMAVETQLIKERESTFLSLELSILALQELISHLEELFIDAEFKEMNALELRHSLPQGWTLFWKRREEGGLALLAHPEAEEWVGTLSLDLNFGRQLIQLLRQLENEGKSFQLNQVGQFKAVSNLRIRFSRK